MCTHASWSQAPALSCGVRLRAPLPLLLLLALARLAASAQTPDTTAAWRYFPLAVGSEWHSTGSYNNGYWTEQSRTRSVVVGEVPGTLGHYTVEGTYQYQQFPQSPVVTTYGSSVWYYDAATERVVGTGMPCPMGAPFDASVACGTTTYAVTGGHQQAVAVGPQTVVTTRKQFRAYASNPNGPQFIETTYVYAVDLGEVSYSQSQFNGTDLTRRTRTLSYARVGGQEYGQPLSFPVADESGPAAGALALSVGPNPAAGATTVRFTLAAPAAVRLTVTDVRGREVAVGAEGEWPAGAHSAALDASRLATGLYVVRLTAGVAVATRRFTVVR